MTGLRQRLRRERPHRTTRRTKVVAGLGAVLVVGAGVVVAVATTSTDTVTAEVAVSQQTSPAPGLSAEVSERLSGILARSAPSEPQATPVGDTSPRRLLIPSIGVDAGVVPIVLDGRELEPPADPDVLGWWSQGATPGDPEGSALITGHSVHTGGGALQDLGEVDQGDEVLVESGSETIDYVVTSSVVLDKDELAEQASALFDQSAAGRVVLVTCDDWNGSEWLSNSVVTAEPVGGAPVTTS